MPWAPGWAEPLEARISFFTLRIVEGKQLGDHAAHGVAADDGLLDIQMVEDRRGIIGEHFDRILLDLLARLAGAAVVEQDDFVIAGKLRHLVKLPGLMIETGDAAKKQRRAVAVGFVIDLAAVAIEKWHEGLPCR